jgi:hypothetical protein
VKRRYKRRERRLFISRPESNSTRSAAQVMSRSKTSGLAEILFARHVSTRTKWRYNPIKATLHVCGSDFVTDLRTIRNKIIVGEIRLDLDAIVYRGVFALRGRHLRDWLSGVVPNDHNDC